MKKTDLNKLLENLADDADVEEILKTSDLAKSLQNPLSVDDVKEFLTTNDDGKKYLQSYGDTRVTDGIKTWQDNNLPTIINDEVLKATGKKKTPEQIKIEELEKKFNDKEIENQQLANQSKIKDLLTQTGFDPTKTLEFFNTSNIENIETSVGNFKSIVDELVNNGVKTAIADGNYIPPGENGAGELSADDIAKMMM